MNKCFIIGNLVKDPEVRSTNNGKTVCSFTVAVNRASREMCEEPDYFKITAWEKLAENCAKYLHKASKVAVLGAVSMRRYETKSGEKRAYMEISPDSVEFLSAGKKTPQEANKSEFDVSVEDIPF